MQLRDPAERQDRLTILDGPYPDVPGAVDVPDLDGAPGNAAPTGELSRLRRLLIEAEASRDAAARGRDALLRLLEHAAAQAEADAEAIRSRDAAPARYAA